MFFFNKFTLQLNYRPESLMSKLPPTDSRLRKDLQQWEKHKLEESTVEKTRMEGNQRERKKQIKQIFQGKKLDKDEEYYSPQYFKKTTHEVTGEEFYQFSDHNKHGSNYWKDREEGTWTHSPKIFEDGCPPFY
jgi:hypothetical protein